MKGVRFAFMDLRNNMRAYAHRKDKQFIVDKIDLTIESLKTLKKEIKKN